MLPKVRVGRSGARAVLIAAACLALAGCRQDMHDAPSYDPLQATNFFANGAASRPLVPNTVPRGQLRADEHLYTGKINGQVADEFPMPVTRQVLDRGQERFNVYCAPCHGRTGEGNGMIVQRGFRQPPSYHEERLRTAPVGYFFDVMTNGFGAMPDYRGQVTPDDRWRIVAHIRVLQQSHNTSVNDLTPADLDRVKAAAAGTPAKAPGGHGGQD